MTHSSASQLKNTSDDHIPSIMKGLGWKQDHKLENFRLFVGYASVLVSALCAYWDYFVGFHKRFVPITFCVVIYGVLSVCYQLWTWRVERGLIFHGTKKNMEIMLRTKGKKHSPHYEIQLELYDSKENPLDQDITEGKFTDWFDNRGFIVHSKFKAFVEKSIGDQAMAYESKKDH